MTEKNICFTRKIFYFFEQENKFGKKTLFNRFGSLKILPEFVKFKNFWPFSQKL